MRWEALLALSLLGCGGIDDDGTTDPPPPEVLPDGVWEPFPGAHIVDASFALDGDTVWWATSRRISDPVQYVHETAVWVHATSTDGASVVEPTKLSPEDERATWSPDIVVTPQAIVATGRNDGIVLRPYDRSGPALGPVRPVPVMNGATVYDAPDTTLLATASGGVQLVASLRYEMSEVAIVDLDIDGTILDTTFGGQRDIVEPGGSSADGITAAAFGDETLVGWQRTYYACVSEKPALSLTTSVASGVVAPPAQVNDQPADEMAPVIAARGTGAFVAWLAWSGGRVRIQLARFPDVTTVLADLDGPNAAYPYGQYTVTMASADRGAIAVRTETHLSVTPFEYSAGTVLLGTPTLQPLVDVEGASTLVGLQHVSGDRYVLAWREPQAIGAERERLFATELELVANTMRPAPPLAPVTAAPPSKLRCP